MAEATISPSVRGVPRGVERMHLDWWLAGGLFVATFAYLVSLPRGLGLADESFLLYEAKRIRDGEVMYRDFFQFVTPLASYMMAALFWVFGTSMATARVGMAVVHALTATALFMTTRQLAVRRVFAVCVPFAYVGLCHTLWPVASWHWFSTCYAALLLWMVIAEPPLSRWQWPFAEGVVAGLLVGTQQQKGAAVVAGICVLFAVHALIDQRYGTPLPWRRATMRIAWFAAGVAIVVLPLLALFAYLAGSSVLYDALVRFPLEDYRSVLRTAWGAHVPRNAALLSSPTLLRLAPLAVLPPFLQGLFAFLRRRDRNKVQRLASLLVFSGAAPLSIWYYPSLVHIAFVGSPFAICAAVGMEWAAGGLRRLGRIGTALAQVSGSAVAVVLILHLANAAVVLRRMYSVPYDSAFGRVDLPTPVYVAILDEIRARLDGTASRALFCYRHLTGVYLMAGARNPTPYQYLDWHVSPAAHVRKTLEVLAEEDVPLVVIGNYIAGDDPIGTFLNAHYRRASEPKGKRPRNLPWFELLERQRGSAESDGRTRPAAAASG